MDCHKECKIIECKDCGKKEFIHSTLCRKVLYGEVEPYGGCQFSDLISGKTIMVICEECTNNPR